MLKMKSKHVGGTITKKKKSKCAYKLLQMSIQIVGVVTDAPG
jgi:hypothetical protein